jgi:methionyl-tRNA synthetase
LSEIIRFGLDVAELLSTLIYPFLPFSSNKIREMLNLENYDNLLKNASENSPNLLEGVGGFAKDAVLGTPFILYSKIGDMKSKTPSPAALLVEAEKQKLETLRKKFEIMNPPLPNNPEPNPIVSVETQNPPANALMEQKPLIEFPDFEKIDLRIATILEAERVPKSDKLLKLLVDIGYEKRTILSGIAQHFSPESLINQQIMVVANLAPRKMMGHLSHGMVLMTESEDKKLVLVTPQTLALNGGTVR